MSDIQDNTKGKFRDAVKEIRETLLTALTEATGRRYALGAKDRTKVALAGLAALQYQRLQPSLLKLPALIKERAYTLTNRLVILMSLEARGLRKVKLVSQGLENSAFRTEQEFFVDLCQGDDSGFGYVLQQVWDQLALELPALFAYDELQECIPVPGPTLVWLLERLGEKDLGPAWRDDTTLGWLYQEWNTPDKIFVEKKLKGDGMAKGQVEAHEIGYKTQLFTDRYMVEWLLHNTLGDQWRAICQRNGWSKAEEIVRSWKGYVWRELEPIYILHSPIDLSAVKILDPAMGSGHFLVYAFDLLYQLYQVQSEQQGLPFESATTVNLILSLNLHGIDIDDRAVQIGAAALYIKAREKSPDVVLSNLQIVSTNLGLEKLTKEDPSVRVLEERLHSELGLAQNFVETLLAELRHAGSLGSLLQVGNIIRTLVDSESNVEAVFGRRANVAMMGKKDLEAAIYAALQEFVRSHDTGDDLGLQNLAQRLGKGLRLIHILAQRYDIVCANPPYLDTSSLDDEIAKRVQGYSVEAKSDLFALFFICFENLTRNHGLWCVVAQHNWMFLGSFFEFRSHILRENAILKCSHLGSGAFESIGGEVVGSAMVVAQRSPLTHVTGVYHRLVSVKATTDKAKSVATPPKRAIYPFPQFRFAEISGSPMIYWWPEEFRSAYLKAKKIGDEGEIKQGLATGNNDRNTRYWFEVPLKNICIVPQAKKFIAKNTRWYPYVKGATGKRLNRTGFTGGWFA